MDARSILLMLGNQIRETEMDCSHFVQYLYENAGLYYGYAPSRILYDGMEPFRRVLHPRSGDLIVWPGHVGIVVDPEEATFLSALRSGVKTMSYQSSYWKRRGRPHFLRYTGARNENLQTWTTRQDRQLRVRCAPVPAENSKSRNDTSCCALPQGQLIPELRQAAGTALTAGTTPLSA